MYPTQVSLSVEYHVIILVYINVKLPVYDHSELCTLRIVIDVPIAYNHSNILEMLDTYTLVKISQV